MPEAQDAPAACLLEMCLNHHPLSFPLTDRAPGTRHVGAPARGCPCHLSKATCAHVTPHPHPECLAGPQAAQRVGSLSQGQKTVLHASPGAAGSFPCRTASGAWSQGPGTTRTHLDHHPMPSEEPPQSGPCCQRQHSGAEDCSAGRSALGPGVCRAESPRFARGAEAEAASRLPVVRGWGTGLSTQGEEGGKQARDPPAPQH